MAKPYEAWAVLEILGHQRYAGRVREWPIGNATFIRLDVPGCEDRPGFHKIFGAASVFSITPVTEEVARLMVRELRTWPLNLSDLRDVVREELQRQEAVDECVRT